MLRKFLIISFALSLLFIFAETETSAQTRVKFKRGEITGEVTGKLKPNQSREFVLGANEGQEILVNVYSKNGRVKVEGEGGPTTNVFDAIDGDNVIRIYNDSNYLSSYKAVFSINSMVKDVPEEIFFKKGSSSAKVNSTIAGDGERKFLLGAREGQEIQVKIISANNAVMVEGEGFLTENIFDAVDGDNIIRIYNNTNRRANFTAIFTIKTLVNQPATRVTFDKGKFSKTIDLVMSGSEKTKKFVIRAAENQTVNIQIESESDSERITMNLDNGVDGTDDWVDGSGYLVITTGRNGDYIFTVRKADNVSISTTMKVFIGNDQ